MNDARYKALGVLDAADRSDTDSFCKLSNRTDEGERLMVHSGTGLALVSDGLAHPWDGGLRRVLFVRISEAGKVALRREAERRGEARPR